MNVSRTVVGGATIRRMSPFAQRIVAALVALLLVAGVAFLTLWGMGVEVGLGPRTPEPSPTATASPTPAATGSAAPVASGDPQVVFAEIEGQVRAIRLLEAPDIAPAELIGRAALEDELRASFDADYPQERRDADNVTLRALGLLDEDQDVAELQLQLLSDQVIGFYDDTERRMVVVSDTGADATARITYAHEYTHALQDGAFGLDSLETDAIGQDDRNLARISLVEGDASLTMVLWAIANDPAGLGEVASGPVPDMSGIPPWMVAQLSFPYEAGANFVAELYQNGGFDAVDAAFEDPPSSTEQILHFDKYLDGEAPLAVAEVDLATALGAGWAAVPSTTLGEGLIAIWLEHLGAEPGDAADAASGWGGDRVSVASGPDGAVALTLRIAFDAPVHADDFERAYGPLVDGLPFPARLERLGPDELLVVQASDEALLDTLVDAAG